MKNIRKLFSIILCLAMVMGLTMAVSAAEDSAAIIDAAYALEDGAYMDHEVTLTGEIVAVNTPYSEQYENITVTIQVEGSEDQPIMCYRLKGDGAAELTVGDTITVTGTLKNYKGTIEFDAGCALISVVKGEAVVAPTDPAEIIDAAYALEAGTSLPYSATLTGVIVSIDSEYSEQYGNITVTIQVAGSEDQPIQCYRLKGDGAAELAVGDTITVTGTLMNYNGTIEFNSGCTLDAVVKSETPSAPETPDEPETPDAPETPEEPETDAPSAADIIDAAYALGEGESLEYEATLTGVIISVDTEYSEQYNNVTVTIKVAGSEDQPIKCYRLKGDGADTIAVGDTITVTGTLTNYKGTIEFDAGCTLDAVINGSGDNGGTSNPTTGDMSIAAVAVALIAATAGVAIITKKEF